MRNSRDDAYAPTQRIAAKKKCCLRLRKKGAHPLDDGLRRLGRLVEDLEQHLLADRLLRRQLDRLLVLPACLVHEHVERARGDGESGDAKDLEFGHDARAGEFGRIQSAMATERRRR